MASAITNVLGGGIFEGVSKIISLFKISPEVAAANALELQKIQMQMADSAAKAAQAQIDDATANIQAEAKAGSKARPMFMYIIEFILAFNYILAPLVNMFSSTKLQVLSLPSNLLVLFGICLTGYTAFDKISQIMSLPGESTFQIPGVKVGNRS